MNVQFKYIHFKEPKANAELVRSTRIACEPTLIAMIFTMRKVEKDDKSELIYMHEVGCHLREKRKINPEAVKGRVIFDLRKIAETKVAGAIRAPDYGPFWSSWPKDKLVIWDQFMQHLIEDTCQKYMKVLNATRANPERFEEELKSQFSIKLIKTQKDLEVVWKFGLAGLKKEELL